MAKRKSLSHTTRFEVFKRDRFTCQYCGGTPPAVVLVIDHIVPVANGGVNDEGNLITSCFDCNSGKAARSLTEAPESLAKQIEERKERAAQIAGYNEFLLELREQEDNHIEHIGLHWFNQFHPQKDTYVFGDARASSIRTFLKKLSVVELLDAVELAHSIVRATEHYDDKTWRYFCGICWMKIKEGDSDR